MSLTDLQYTVSSTSSLSYGSYLDKDDLNFYTEGRISLNFPFGQSDKDFIKFGVYNFDSAAITSSMIYASGTYTNYTKSFYDVFNQFTEYSYKEYKGDFVVVGYQTQSLFFDVGRNLRDLNIQDGNYKISIELGRNIVGDEKNSDEKLIINTISTSRNEIALVPKPAKGTKYQINTDFGIFSNQQVPVKEVVDELIYAISKPEIYKIYNDTAFFNPTGSAEFKFNYSIKTDVDAICFVIDLYYGVTKGNYRANGQIAANDVLGIYDQFKNWLYQNYNTGKTFQEIKDYYYSLFLYVVDQELNRIQNTKPQSYPQIVEFLQTIFYNVIFYPQIYAIEAKRNIDFSGYFKYYLNFSNGSKISIINQKVVASPDIKFHDALVLKLLSAIPNDLDVGTETWITCDFGFLPIAQNVYFYTNYVVNTIPLRGPNFLIKLENEGNSTEALSMEQLLGETGSLFNELTSKIAAKDHQFVDTTDYRSFENFVNFSSADLRLKAFESKQNQINQIYSNIEEINAGLTINPNDTFYLKQKVDANSEIDNLEAGMDGYERFLYKNPAWYEEHSRGYNGYTSASLYDRNNRGSLINNLPQFMVEDASSNEDYIKFIGMVGHFFDNLSLAAKQYTEKNNIASSPNYGISLDVVGSMLESLGWDTEISKENLPLILSSFSKNDFDVDSPLYSKARSLSEEERNQIIWKRILNSLPFIYKTKGTEASLNALISCFGVPKNIIKIKEYGGIQNISDLTDKSLYIIEDVKYEPYFSGSGEYFKLNWTGSAKTVELNFRFDTRKIHDDGVVFRLANCSDKWAVGVVREKGLDWGTMFFTIDDGNGYVKTAITSRAPLFDGSSYHAMLRRNEVIPSFNATIDLNEYPTRYDLVVQKSEDDRITYEVTSSIFLSGSFNYAFESGSHLYIGNYNQNTASLNIDPEAFFGNIDDIRIWETSLSNNRFLAHSLNRSGYDLDNPSQMISSNLYRISFERPLDLYDTTNYGIQLNNLAFRNDFPTFYAINFPEVLGLLPRDSYCDPSEGPSFPYQFTRKDVRLTMNLPDYGSNKFRNNKINFVNQELSTNLSADTRSSYMMSELINVDANKLGIFFSPSEIQNTEIIKFFGEFNLGDLIGNPSDVYNRTYQKFERFREMYYEQGFGNIDFTFFMNIIRFYFDKAMFKYIRGIVPARAKLVDGILIEPSILERPKLEMRPVVKEEISQKVGNVDGAKNIHAEKDPSKVGRMYIDYKGISTYSDVNQVRFPIEEDPFGFTVFAEDGITFYQGEFYRVDIAKYTKAYQVSQRYVKPYSQLTESEAVNDFNGKTQTVKRTYSKVNMVKLPSPNKYPMTASFYSTPYGDAYFSGSLYFDANLRGWQTFTMYTPHTIVGIMSGSVVGLDTLQNPSSSFFINGNVFSPGLTISGSMIPNGKYVTYSGLFDTTDFGYQVFEGNIYGQNLGNTTSDKTCFNIYFMTGDATSSIFHRFSEVTSKELFGPLAQGVSYRKQYSLEYTPPNSTLLYGYKDNHYKYTKQQFSTKEINSYVVNPVTNAQNNYKWKRGSQNKKTTVDPTTGLLNNTEAVEVKNI